MHSRGKKSSSTHQNTDASFPNQETLTSQLFNPTHWVKLHNKKEPQTSRIQKAHSRHSNLNKVKRQKNTQQVKEHEKCPPSQIKEEEIGNLPETKFRIMMIKMIQNLENKIELQINGLETKIEKMQEMFNRDLEEIKKKSQLKINNSINEIKNTLEGNKSRIMETEDRISEVADKMVEINEAERKKEERIKINEENLRDLWDNVKCPNIRIIGIPEEEDQKESP